MFLAKLKHAIEENHLFSEKDRILIGVSGGPDSMALLHGMLQLAPDYGWKIYAVHVNHQLRHTESDLEAQYVRAFCDEHRIPCVVKSVSVQSYLEQEGGNLQAVARGLRYEAFAQVANQWGIDRLALAHHADDQVETILMRLLRGTGVSGLQGMPLRRDWNERELVRPLMMTFREEIEAYCEANQLAPKMDSSNLSSDYTRNQIRHRLIPEMLHIHPQTKKSFLQLQEIVEEEEKHWQIQVTQAFHEVVMEKEEDCIKVDVAQFQKLSPALQRRLLKLLLNYLVKNGTNDLSWNQIEQSRYIALHTHPSVAITLAGGIEVYREYLHMIIQRTQNERKDTAVLNPYPIHCPGKSDLPFFQGCLLSKITTSPITVNHTQGDWAVFDADRLEGERFYVRSRLPGDRMTIWGMDGSKKVKKIMMEAKIPRVKRNRHPVILVDKKILWIPGVQRSNVAPVSSHTKQFLYLFWFWVY